MKNGLLIWNILLTLGLGYLLISSFSSSKKTTGKQTTSITNDSLHSRQPFSIAYVEMDSVQEQYDLAKEATSEIRKQEEGINARLESMEQNYRNKVIGYQNKAQQMTQEEGERASQDVMQMQETIRKEKEKMMGNFNEFVSRKNKEVRDKIKDFLADYNRDGRYSYIISYEPGLFYYSDTVYNITKEVIRGLNISHRKKKE